MGIRIGLTGGIGSGKSTAAKILADLGAWVVSADEVAHELMQPGTSVFKEIVAHFGEQVLGPSGEIDRKRLGELVFKDPRQRVFLEGVTHPAIARAANQRLSLAAPNQPRVYEMPLLVELDAADQFDEVLVITTPHALRIERLLQRGLSAAEAEARIKAQASDAERHACATKVIVNDGSVTDLRNQLESWWRTLFKN